MKRLIITTLLLCTHSAGVLSQECTVLLHGLIRSSDSMEKLEEALKEQGHYVANIDYPSRDFKIEKLSEIAVNAGLAKCKENNAAPINFVTHSLGGILVRQYYSQHQPDNVNRVVMLAPPNNGSEVVDNLKNVPGFAWINGPAGLELGTDSGSVPVQLGPVNFELGVIAGTRSINLILSNFLPNPDDGKVSVESAKVKGMCGFVALPTSHPFIMKNKTVINEVINFLKDGQFLSEEAQALECPNRHVT